MRQRRLVLIGFGAIAGELATSLLARREPVHKIGVLLKPDSRSRERVPADCTLLSDLGELSAFKPDLVIEAAGHEAVRTTVPGCLGLVCTAVTKPSSEAPAFVLVRAA